MIREYEKFVKYWQVRLGLSDWEFQVIIVDSLETAGRVEFSPISKRAVIKVNPKIDSWLNKDESKEFVILHELLHIVTFDVIDNECDEALYFNAKERTMNVLAEALIKEKYDESKHNTNSKKSSRKE